MKGTDLHSISRAILEKKGLTDIKEDLRKLGKARNQVDYYKITIFPIDESNTKYYIKLARDIIRGLYK